jgi:hypothetical protein
MTFGFPVSIGKSCPADMGGGVERYSDARTALIGGLLRNGLTITVLLGT